MFENLADLQYINEGLCFFEKITLFGILIAIDSVSMFGAEGTSPTNGECPEDVYAIGAVKCPVHQNIPT